MRFFGLVSFAVAQRTREFGVRVALGASPRELLVSIVRGALALVAIGLVLGLGGALLLTSVLDGLLYGASPGDPITFAAVAATLAMTAVVATIVPAWHASAVNPIVALRAESADLPIERFTASRAAVPRRRIDHRIDL